MHNQNGKTTKYSLGTSSFSLQLAARYYLLLRDIILKFVCYKVDGLDFLLTEYEIVGWYNKLEKMKQGSLKRLVINTRLMLIDGGLMVKEYEDLFKIRQPQISIALKSSYLKNGSIADLKLMLLPYAEIKRALDDSE